MRNILIIFLALLHLTLFTSCNDTNKRNVQQIDKSIDKEQLNTTLEKANRYMILQEVDLINDYIERHNLNMYETGTGLRYQIIKKGDDELIKKGDIVTLEYEIRFLTGDLVYSSKERGNMTFVVGRGSVEIGLEEAILKLHKNDTAILILPAHLAHGLIGDGDKIPPRTALVYKVKILDNQLYNDNEKK